MMLNIPYMLTMFKVVQHDQQGTMKTIVEVGHKTTFSYHLHAL